MQEEVQKKEDFINMLLHFYNVNQVPSSQPKKPQIRKPLEEIKIKKSLPLPKSNQHQLIEEKIKNIDNKINNARQKSLLLKNEKVHKMKEEYLKRVEELNNKQATPNINKASYRQYNSVPPKTTDNSYPRASSMQEILDENPLQQKDVYQVSEKPARVLKTSTPYKTNAQNISLKEHLQKRDFADINSFQIIGNYVPPNSQEKVFNLNLGKNLANLRFSKENPKFDTSIQIDKKKSLDGMEYFMEKKPMLPAIKNSLELKSRSEFMKLDLNLQEGNIFSMNQSNEEIKKQSLVFGFADFKLTPDESKKMFIPYPLDFTEENEFHEFDTEKNQNLEILVEDHKSNNILVENNEGYKPYTTNTSMNTINTSVLSKNQRFPHDVFNHKIKKKLQI